MSEVTTLRSAARHAVRVLNREGVAGVTARLGRRLINSAAQELDVGLHGDDIVRPVTAERVRARSGKLHLTAVMTPPAQQSGGHTTVMRALAEMEARGHRCTIALYDAYSDDACRHSATVRHLYPSVSGDVVDARRGLPDSDLLLASSWQTAHVIARSSAAGRRCYLVQDFEPWFYPRGTASALAEQTYRLGMTGIAIGGWLADLVRSEYGMDAVSFPYACDVAVYDRPEASTRTGVVFYARPRTPRRGYGLGMLALRLVHEARPEVPIHLFGERTGWSDFPVVEHGTLAPPAIARLYAGSTVGLALSMTDVSLTPMEMLASGLPCVVNDSPWVRADLTGAPVTYAAPTPEALAEALLHHLDRPLDEVRRDALRESMRPRTWEHSLGVVADRLEALAG